MERKYDLKDKSMRNEHKEDTLRKRYFFKLSSNFVSGGISAIIQLMVPRSLGPTAYGNFGFLTVFFNNVVGTLDMGSSFWFYTKLSQEKDNKIIIFYRFIMSVIVLLVLGFVIIATSTTIREKIWLGQSNQVIYMAMIFAIMTWALGIKTKIIDAHGLTVDAEKGRIVQRIVALIIILILFLINRLNLFTFFIYHYFIIAILWIFFDLIIRRKGFSAGFKFRIKREESKVYFKNLFEYVNPLVVYTIIGLVVGVLDRWLLQKFGGSIQQGFFTLSYKISDIISLVTVSLTPLLMREFSIAFGKKDMHSMKRLFRRYIPIMYGITAYLSCFVAVQSDKIVLMIGGGEYKDARIAVMIMAFYPVYLTYGQLTSTIFYATGQTKLYRNIGVLGLLLGLPIIYFLIAPKSAMGLDAKAIGLAIKMVLINMITVNIWLYYSVKLLGLSFSKFLLHQFGSLGIMASVALLIKFGVDNINILSSNVIISFLLSGIIYTVLIAVISYYFPKLFGLDKKIINSIRTRLVNWAGNIAKKIRK